MKILFVLSRIPYPLEKGDKLRAYNHLRYLSKRHEIILFALYEKEIHPKAKEELEKYCSSICFVKLNPLSIFWNIIKAFFNKKPLQLGYFYQCSARKKLDSFVEKEKPDRIFCQLIRTASYVKNYELKKVIDYQDVLSIGMKRRMEKAAGLKSWFFRTEWKRLERYEKKVFEQFDERIIISQPDKALIPHPDKHLIHIIPNGVDFDFFQAKEVEKEYDLVFIGNMSYPPNVQAARYLVNSILPVVRKSRPGIKVLIAGSSPHKSVRALASRQVIVSGWVDDIRNSYASAKIFVAPMQLGTGLQNKLLEAMAMGIACITSPLANDALAAKEGEEILLGRSPEEYSWHINMLLDDKAFYDKIAENGYQYVHKNYNWDELCNELERIIIS